MMISKYDMEDCALIALINEQYGLNVEGLSFIPMGDSAYSYKVFCMDRPCYYLKLFDRCNDKQKRSVDNLDSSLALTWMLYHRNIFTRLTYPIHTRSGAFKADSDNITLVLFRFVEGDTLADAYPFSDELLEKVGASMAVIHRTAQEIDPHSIAVEQYDIAFVDELKQCLSQLENSELQHPHHMALQRLVMPNKQEIRGLVKLLHHLHASVQADQDELVLCHGDIWGGNLILDTEQNLMFLDWENAVLAPPERDLFGYIGDRFELLFSAYERELNRPVKLDNERIQFYAYRHHLRNLTNWMMNILYRNSSSEQQENDLDMIENHCMNRWGSIEEHLLNIQMNKNCK